MGGNGGVVSEEEAVVARVAREDGVCASFVQNSFPPLHISDSFSLSLSRLLSLDYRHYSLPTYTFAFPLSLFSIPRRSLSSLSLSLPFPSLPFLMRSPPLLLLSLTLTRTFTFTSTSKSYHIASPYPPSSSSFSFPKQKNLPTPKRSGDSVPVLVGVQSVCVCFVRRKRTPTAPQRCE